MMRVLVTGAGGMVGSHMVEVLYARDHDVVGTYYKPTVEISEISRDIKLIECDVRYYKKVLDVIEKYRPDWIFHLAAQSFPTVSWERPQETMDVNVNGTIAIFEAVKHIRKWFSPSYDPMVVVACSSAEYGESLNKLEGDDIFIGEDTALLPLHPYGVSKVAQDLLSFQYYMNDNIRCIRARIFNSTGTRKIHDVTSDFTKRAVESEMDGSYRIYVGNMNTRRAIMDQRDLINALLLLAGNGGAGEVYNISSEKIYSGRDIIRYIEAAVGHDYKTIVDERLLRPTDERVIAGDVSKLKRDTGWVQEIPMEKTVSDMIAYWRMKI